MRVAIACHGLYPEVAGGMERHTFNLAKHLVASGVEVDVLVPGPAMEAIYPFPVRRLPWPKRPIWLWSNYDFSRHAANWVDLQHPDVVFSQGFGFWAYLSRRRCPVVFHPHGLEMFSSELTSWERTELAPLRSLVRRHVQHSDAVVSLGGRLTGILKEKMHIDSPRLVEISNAIDLLDFPPSDSEKCDRSLLVVSRLAFNKGIDLLSRAMSRMTDVSCSLTIVGDGPGRPAVERMAQRDSRVRYLGRLVGEPLRKEYLAAEALLLPSRTEGMPTVILEAMASQCAVVATRVGAVETMVSEETGILADPNENAFEGAIRKFLDLPSHVRRGMGEIGRTIVERQFTWDVVTPQYIALFRRLLGQVHA